MDREQQKRLAAQRAATYVEKGSVVGVGTGSTVAYFIDELGKMRHDIDCAVSSSERSTELLRERGIRVVDLNSVGTVPLYVDGADECDAHKRLIKGGGAALTREKIIAAASERFVCMIDAAKRVDVLGKFPLPVEVIPLAVPLVRARLQKLCPAVTLRAGKDGAPFVTDNSNHILDCAFGAIDDTHALANTLDRMVGVVEHGLFLNMAERALLGTATGVDEMLSPR